MSQSDSHRYGGYTLALRTRVVPPQGCRRCVGPFCSGLQLLTLTSVGMAVVLYRRKRNVKAMMMAFLNSQFFIVVEVRPQMQSRGTARLAHKAWGLQIFLEHSTVIFRLRCMLDPVNHVIPS